MYQSQRDRNRAAGIGMTSERTRRRLIDQVREMGVTDRRVLDVMFSLPRHLFIDEALSNRAYDNISLPIGYGQTISQPYIVGLTGGQGTGKTTISSILMIILKKYFKLNVFKISISKCSMLKSLISYANNSGSMIICLACIKICLI